MLTAKERKNLQALLSHAVKPDETMNLDQLEGYLFGVVITPDVTRPSEWFADIFGEAFASFDTQEEANDRFTGLMEAYNRLNTLRLRGALRFPFDLASFDRAMLDRVRDWAVGFDRGLALRSYVWVPEEELEKEEIPEDVEEIITCISIVLGVAHPEQIPEIFEGVAGQGEDTQEIWTDLVGRLPEAVTVLLAHARDLEAQRLANESAAPVAGRPKSGRNDPCPCGSGKKYKKCCGLN